MTEHTQSGRHPLAWTARSVLPAALCCLACAALLAVSGCSGGPGTGAGSSDASPTAGARMAGPAVDVNVTPEALASSPKAPVLSTPESAVRSYLDWTTYAYRIGQSQFATPTMTPYEEVRVDSFVQYNIQQSRLLDQTLVSITFGTPSVGATRTLVPAKESWTYRYVSIDVGNRVIGGPYKAAYDSTYTVVKSEGGAWVVDKVDATPKGTVK
jgi:hypothetical protein